jgi:methionine aminotransferase
VTTSGRRCALAFPARRAGRLFPARRIYDITDEDDQAFCIRLIEGMASPPSTSVFYETPPAATRIIRFCFAKTEATLAAAAGDIAI